MTVDINSGKKLGLEYINFLLHAVGVPIGKMANSIRVAW